MKIAIVTGEASGDLLGARLIHVLKEHYPKASFEGIGGPLMQKAGCQLLFDSKVLGVMGLIEPLVYLPQLFKLRRQLYQHFIQHPPDLFIGIDAPDFNLGLELKLRRAGIKVVHYVSPSVWAWRQKRIHKIAKAVDLMLTLFPFEAQFYERHGVPVRYVGHPLAEQIPVLIDQSAAKRNLALNETTTYIALLPGSRCQELHYMSIPFLLAAKKVWRQNPNVRFLTAHVNEERQQEFISCYQQHAPEIPLEFFKGRAHEVMAAADLVVVTSGTASLEAMLYKKPMIIAYRMSSLVYPLAKLLVKIPFIGLPNLLANELIVPELIQYAVTPENIAKHLIDYVKCPDKILTIKQKLTKLHQKLFKNSSQEIVEALSSLGVFENK